MRLSAIRLLLIPAILVALSLVASTGSKTAHRAAVGERNAAAKCPQGLVRERGDGYDRDKASCQRLGHPESYADLLKANSSLGSRSTAPFSTLKPGAFAHAIAQKNALAQEPASAAAAGDGNWTPAGTTPLDASNTDFDQTNGSTLEGFKNLSGRINGFAYSSSGSVFAAVTNAGIWQTDDTGKNWRSIGDGLPTQVVSSVDWSPARGGTILALTGDSAYAFATLGGLGAFWSTDDGATWHQASGIPGGVLGFRIRVDPSNPNIVYAATGDGLFRSTDDGQSFTNVDLPTGPCHGDSSKKDCFLANMVTDVVVQAPANANTFGVFAKPGAVMAVVGWRAGTATNDDKSVQSPNNGIYVSTTGAPGSFTKIDTANSGFAGGDQTEIGRVALGIANGPSQDHRIVYALIEDANKFNGSCCSDTLDGPPPGTPGSTVLGGIYVTSDFGQTWTEVESSTVLDNDQTSGSALEPAGKLPGVGQYEPGVQAWYNEWIEPDPTRADSSGAPTRVVLGLEELWENDQPPAPLPAQGLTGPGTFRVIGRYWNTCDFIINGAPKCGPGRGNDAGKANTTTTHPDQHGGLFVPDGKGGVTLFAGSDGGAYTQHVDSGGDFQNANWGDGAQGGLHTLEPYDAEIAKDGTVYMGMQDNGEGKILPDGHQFEVFGGDGFFTGVDPNNSSYAYEEYTGGIMSATTDGGKNWVSIDPGLTSPQFSTPFVVDPNNAKHVMIGGRDIEETTFGADTCSAADGSNCWKKVFDLGTQKNPGDPNAPDSSNPVTGDPANPNNQLSAVDLRSDAAYVGYCGYCDTITQPVTATTPFQNGIATNVGGNGEPKQMTSSGWHIAKAAGLPNRYISAIAMNPQNENQVFVALAGYGRHWAPPGAVGDDTSRVGSGHVFVSDDAGRTFRDISGDLPDTPADSLVIRGGRIVVGTDIGVFVSSSLNGGHYGVLGTGLPNVPVFHLALKQGDPNTMVAATYGRGVYLFHFNSSPGPGPSSGQTGCGDVLAPRTSISRHSLRASHSNVSLSGRSIDRKCRHGVKPAGLENRVPTVQVYVARVTTSGKAKGAARRCRFLQRNGRLSKSRSCSKPIWLHAKTRFVKKTNKTLWTFSKKRIRLSRGTYLAAARGTDPFHHVETQLRHHNVTHFRIR